MGVVYWSEMGVTRWADDTVRRRNGWCQRIEQETDYPSEGSRATRGEGGTGRDI